MNHTQTTPAKTTGQQVEAFNAARDAMLTVTEQFTKLDTLFRAIFSAPADEEYEVDHIRELAKIGLYLTAQWTDTADVQRERLDTLFHAAWDDCVSGREDLMDAFNEGVRLRMASESRGQHAENCTCEIAGPFKVPQKDAPLAGNRGNAQ